MLWMRRLFLILAWSTIVSPAQGSVPRSKQNGLPPSSSSVAKTLKELDSVNDLMFKITLKACAHSVDTNRLNTFRDHLTQIIHTAELGKYHTKSHHFPEIGKTLKWCHEHGQITASKPKKDKKKHKHSLGKAAPLNLRLRQKFYSTLNYMMTIVLTSCSPEVHREFKDKGIKLPPTFKQEFIFLLSKNMDAFDSALKKKSIQEALVEELFEELHTCSQNI